MMPPSRQMGNAPRRGLCEPDSGEPWPASRRLWRRRNLRNLPAHGLSTPMGRIAKVITWTVWMPRIPSVRPRSEAALNLSYPTTLASRRQPTRVSRWRFWVACGAAVALILPSVALLPAASSGFEFEPAHDDEHFGTDRDGAAGTAEAHLADIPGSPTHPANHDCTPCQVIKYLATSVLPQADLALAPLERNDAPPPGGRHPLPVTVRVAIAPPIRAPPHPPV